MIKRFFRLFFLVIRAIEIKDFLEVEKMESITAALKEKDEYLKKLGQVLPRQMAGFARLKEGSSAGVLDEKTRKLIGVSLGVASQCHWCIAIHVKEALDAGATKEEIPDSGWQAVFMGGGPKLMYMQYVVKALEELAR